MKRHKIFFLLLCTLLSSYAFISDVKVLDLNAFKITIPKSWSYKKEQGIDSFIGVIVTQHSKLTFDFSSMGYAGSLIPTEQEYLSAGRWLPDCPFCETGVTYTAKFNIRNEKLRQMKEKGITDSTLIRVEDEPEFAKEIHKPNVLEKQKYSKADYIGTLTYKDHVITVPIAIPDRIKFHNIKIDTMEKYIVKTIWPKKNCIGTIGIYFKRRKDGLTFNIVGYNFDKIEQDQALTAFKTIKISE